MKKSILWLIVLSAITYNICYGECRYVTIYPIGGLPETILVCD